MGSDFDRHPEEQEWIFSYTILNKYNWSLIHLVKNIGKETIWSEKKPKKTYSFKDRKQFNKFFNFENNKKNILFLPHAMSDNIFNNEWNVFKTSYNWFYETISEINNLDYVNWIIKPHPYEYKFPGVTARDVFNEKVKEGKKNIFFLNENIHINEIYKYVDVVLTGNGSAGFEYPSLGIPTITTSDAKYSNFKFTYAPKYKKDLGLCCGGGCHQEKTPPCLPEG